MITLIVAIIVAVAVIGGGAVYAYSHMKRSAVMASNLVIQNTGSTNMAGWDLTVKSDGSGMLEYTSGTNSKTFPSGSFAVKDFSEALASVGTVSDLQPTGQLMKSASFGTSEYAQYQGHKSGDLNESYDKNSAAQKRLYAVLKSMVAKAGPTQVPRFQMRERLK